MIPVRHIIRVFFGVSLALASVLYPAKLCDDHFLYSALIVCPVAIAKLEIYM